MRILITLMFLTINTAFGSLPNLELAKKQKDNNINKVIHEVRKELPFLYENLIECSGWKCLEIEDDFKHKIFLLNSVYLTYSCKNAMEKLEKINNYLNARFGISQRLDTKDKKEILNISSNYFNEITLSFNELKGLGC